MKGTGSKNSLLRSGGLNKDTETKLIIKALSNSKQSLTRRQLSAITHLEIATLCRALFHLVYKRKKVVIAKYGRCKTTRKLVMHFALPKKGTQRNGN